MAPTAHGGGRLAELALRTHLLVCGGGCVGEGWRRTRPECAGVAAAPQQLAARVVRTEAPPLRPHPPKSLLEGFSVDINGRRTSKLVCSSFCVLGWHDWIRPENSCRIIVGINFSVRFRINVSGNTEMSTPCSLKDIDRLPKLSRNPLEGTRSVSTRFVLFDSGLGFRFSDSKQMICGKWKYR